MQIIQTLLSGVAVAKSDPVADNRGVFFRMFCERELAPVMGERRIVQVNHSLTRLAGALRGMHFQYPPHAEAKLVSCLHGEVFDVAVDLRCGSPTFLHWHGVLLSAQNRQSLLIPEGFAHGFQALTGDCELIYLHTAAYHPEAEGALNAGDPRLGIAWPLAITEISERDRNHKLIEHDFQGIAL